MGRRLRRFTPVVHDNSAGEAPQAKPPQRYRGRGRGRPPKRRAPDSSTEAAAAADLVEQQRQEQAAAESGERRQEQEAAAAESGERRQEQAAAAPAEEQQPQAGKEEEELPQDMAAAAPIGEPVKVTGRRKRQKMHYRAFQYNGYTYELEDSVLIRPQESSEKPYVAILKDITETEGRLSVTGQWFYRPHEADIGEGKFCIARDTRELYYSFHVDDVPAETVKHRCLVHFIPQHKQIPLRKKHPGFFVQKIYGAVEKKLWDLTDKDYEDIEEDKQKEIAILVKKTIDRIGNLSDLEPENTPGDSTEQFSNKWSLHNKDVNQIDTTRKPLVGQPKNSVARSEIPESAKPRNYAILARYNALTGDEHRDKWLDKLLQSIPLTWSKAAQVPHADPGAATKSLSNSSSAKDNEQSYILHDVVPIIVAIERFAHEALGTDFRNYDQKLRQLSINIKKSSKLCRRLMGKELDPAALLTMSPDELKAGLTAAEKSSEPEQSKQLQRTDARCQRCQAKNVGISDIMHLGYKDRNQLECTSCGNKWFSSYDDVASLTVDGPSTAAGNVAPGSNRAKADERQQRSDQPARAAACAFLKISKTKP